MDCGDRGLSSLPPLYLLPPGSRSLLLVNNKLASLGASAFANLSSLEVWSLLIFIRKSCLIFSTLFKNDLKTTNSNFKFIVDHDVDNIGQKSKKKVDFKFISTNNTQDIFKKKLHQAEFQNCKYYKYELLLLV